MRIVEVGPRDGLQNEAATVPIGDKVAFVEALAAAGLPSVEVTAFVNPKWVPQMADADAVYRGVSRRPGTGYPALVPNVAGLERALGVERRRGRDLRSRIGDLQPPQHQPVDRRVARIGTRTSRAVR